LAFGGSEIRKNKCCHPIGLSLLSSSCPIVLIPYFQYLLSVIDKGINYSAIKQSIKVNAINIILNKYYKVKHKTVHNSINKMRIE
jgi:hypothetical protein